MFTGRGDEQIGSLILITLFSSIGIKDCSNQPSFFFLSTAVYVCVVLLWLLKSGVVFQVSVAMK